MVSYTIFVTLYLGVSTTWEWQLWEIFPILHLGCQAYIQTEKDRWEKVHKTQMRPQNHSRYSTNCRVLCTVFIIIVMTRKQSESFCSNVHSFFKGDKKSSLKKLCVLLKTILMKKQVRNKIAIHYEFIDVFLLEMACHEQRHWKQQEQLFSSVQGRVQHLLCFRYRKVF